MNPLYSNPAYIYSGQRQILWKKLQGLRSWTAFWTATAWGAGLAPIAPGTFGTCVGIPLTYLSIHWPTEWRLLFWLGLTVLGSWAAAEMDQMMETQDNQNIVIDEVVGFGITAWTVDDRLWTWVLAFFLFRFFDVLKPPPVRQIDQWSKRRSSPIWGGIGVMMDDVIAGFQGLGVISVLQFLRFLPS